MQTRPHRPDEPDIAFLVALIVFLGVYNNATNLLGLPEDAYVPLNLLLAAVLLTEARRRGHDWTTVGFGRGTLAPGLRWGAAAAAVVAAGLVVAAAWPVTEPLLHDQRVAGLSAAGVAYHALVRIPFGTVLWEEVAFRGVLFGVWARARGTRRALLGSSAVFGLWHIGPVVVLLRENRVPLDAAGWAAVGGGVAATAVAGLLFGALRIRTGGIVAPALTHLATNSLGAVAASLAQRG